MEIKEFPVYKGLQKPLIFKGFRGRYIIWAAVAAGGSFLLCALGVIFDGMATGMISFTISIIASFGFIFFKQKKGLHDKKRNKGIYCIKNIYQIS